MGGLGAFWRSTIGKKVVMAVTGIILVTFVIGHVAGNLQIFAGAERFNRYAAFLKGLGELLWLARLGLLASVVLHFTAAFQLTQLAKAARPADYAKRNPQVSTFASKSMRWGGVLLLFFIVFHLAQFTLGWVDSTTFSHTDAYNNVMIGFSNPLYVAFYEVAMVSLALHLFHGVWASVRTLGLAKPSQQPLHRRVATVIAMAVWLGFAIIPLGVLLGIAKPATEPTATAAAPSAPRVTP